MNSNHAPGHRRVVVTGLGAVTAAGWGVKAFQEAQRAGCTAIRTFGRFDNARQRTHIAGQVPDGTSSTKCCVCWSRLSNADRFGLFSALEAVEQAKLTLPMEGQSVGVFFGSSTGGLFEAEQYFEQLVRDRESRPRRSLLASHMLSAPAETVARHLGVQGPVETVSSACASGGQAIEQALRAVRTSEVDIAVVGAADCLSLTTYSGFNSLRAVDDRPCRPFRADRGGMSLGEGGAVLILEALEHVESRKGRPLAEVLGAGSSCDANHMTAPHEEGLWAAAALERALADAHLEPSDIEMIGAHGTGTILNDMAECSALRHIFGERIHTTPVEAVKGLVGHLLGAAGVIGAVSVVLALQTGEVQPTPGGGVVDPALSVGLVLDGPRALPGSGAAMTASLGFGGANAVVVFGRWKAS